MRPIVKIALSLAGLLVFLAGILGFAHWRASVTLKDQYSSVVTGTQRPLAHTRGLLNSMLEQREKFIPAFLPEHLSDQALCAGAIVTAVNFLLGCNKLVDSAAWQFGNVNKSALELLYDRSDDFEFRDDLITTGSHWIHERNNSPFKLSALLRSRMQSGTTDRLIVIGYHYKETQSDDKIYADRTGGGGLNSHLMLLVGKKDTTWYGYHLFHKPAMEESPFLIASLADDMPDSFDLMYIWEVRGTRMPEIGAPLQFEQHLSPYASIKRLVGHRFLDQALIHLFSNDDQFPHIGLRTENGTLNSITKMIREILEPQKPLAPERVLSRVVVSAEGLQQTVRAHVHQTPGADLAATFVCNGWDISSEARHKVYLHQVFKLCGKVAKTKLPARIEYVAR